MRERVTSFSIIRLNEDECGWAVVEDPRGAIVQLPSEPEAFKLAFRLTKAGARELADKLTEDARNSAFHERRPRNVSALLG